MSGKVDLATVKRLREDGLIILSVVVEGKVLNLALSPQKAASIAGLLVGAVAEEKGLDGVGQAR